MIQKVLPPAVTTQFITKVTLIIVTTLLQAHSFVYIHVTITNLRKIYLNCITWITKAVSIIPPTSGSGSVHKYRRSISVWGVKTNCTLF